MPITRDEVAHLARLSRIALSDAELDHLAPQLDQIITAVAQVQEVAAEGIPPTSHATGLTNVYRDDEPGPCLSPAEALDRITIPADAVARITEALTTGGSIIVSDQGINQGETGEGTDFIVSLR